MKMPNNNFIMCYRDDKTDKISFRYRGNVRELLTLAYGLLHRLYSEIIGETDKKDLQRLNKEMTNCIFDNL